MNTAKKLIATATLAALSGVFTGAGLAAETHATKAQVEKEALAIYPGKVEHAKMEKKQGKEVWEVKIKGHDGKEHTLYFDAKTGKEVTM